MERLAIHSAPRSGSTWLGSLLDANPNIVYKFQPLFSYEFKGALNQNSTKQEIEDFYKKLVTIKSEFLDQTLEKKREISPVFHKEEVRGVLYKEVRYHQILANLLNTDPKVKVIGLIRDPRAVLYSWWNAPREFKKQEWDFQKEWYTASKKNEGKVENFYGYQKWKEIALLFLRLEKSFPSHFKIVKYSDLLKNTKEVVNNIMSFCEFDLHQQQIDFIDNHNYKHDKDSYSVYKVKKEDNAWLGKLPLNVVNYIEKDLYKTQLEAFLK